MFAPRFLKPLLLALCLTVVGISAVSAQNPFRRSDFELASSDLPLVGAAAQKLYAEGDVPIGTKEQWKNPETGNFGTVVLIGTSTYEGLPCRRLQHDIYVKKADRTYRYIFDRCQVADGSWKIL